MVTVMGKSMRGLSPRVRGNPSSERVMDVKWGPIPACAGESALSSIVTSAGGAYPRVCGGICCR